MEDRLLHLKNMLNRSFFSHIFFYETFKYTANLCEME